MHFEAKDELLLVIIGFGPELCCLPAVCRLFVSFQIHEVVVLCATAVVAGRWPLAPQLNIRSLLFSGGHRADPPDLGGGASPPGLKLNLPPSLFCVSWRPDFQFWGTHTGRLGIVPADGLGDLCRRHAARAPDSPPNPGWHSAVSRGPHEPPPVGSVPNGNSHAVNAFVLNWPASPRSNAFAFGSASPREALQGDGWRDRLRVQGVRLELRAHQDAQGKAQGGGPAGGRVGGGPVGGGRGRWSVSFSFLLR